MENVAIINIMYKQMLWNIEEERFVPITLRSKYKGIYFAIKSETTTNPTSVFGEILVVSENLDAK